MSLRSPLVAFGICAAAAGALAKDTPDELIPAAMVSDVALEAKQDGRALRVQVANNTPLVITAIRLRCFEPPAPPRPGCRRSPLDLTADDLLPEARRSEPAPTCLISVPRVALEQDHYQTILPGKAARLYVELNPGVQVQDCKASEARGRPKRWFEF